MLSSSDISPVVVLPQNEPKIKVTHSPVIFYAEFEPQVVPLTDRIAEKIGLTSINLRKIARWGLSLAAEFSYHKFSFSTNPAGEITAHNLDTRLLGLSIPVRKKTTN